jgi:hypothetical protein
MRTWYCSRVEVEKIIVMGQGGSGGQVGGGSLVRVSSWLILCVLYPWLDISLAKNSGEGLHMSGNAVTVTN